MLSPSDWWLTGKILYNLARFWPELKKTAAPIHPVPEYLQTWAAMGVYDVRILDLKFGRVTLPLEAGTGPFPVIIFSGGGADDGTGYEALAGHWASHGFVVLQPIHADAYTYHFQKCESVFWAHQKATWDVWSLALGDLEPWRERVRDIVRVVDELPLLEERLGLRLDASRVGAGGYSYGAQVALLLGGARFPHRGRKYHWPEPRIKACLAITPEAGGRRAPRRIWDGLNTPTLWMTGDKDLDVQGRDWRSKGTGFRFSPPGDKWLALVHGANHFAFSGRMFEEAKRFEDHLAQEVIFDVVKGLTTLYWAQYLHLSPAKLECELGEIQDQVVQIWRR